MIHNQSGSDANPFEVAHGATNTSRSGSNRASGASKKFAVEQTVVPPMFFDEEYQIDRAMV
jgi:hypothetical protein